MSEYQGLVQSNIYINASTVAKMAMLKDLKHYSLESGCDANHDFYTLFESLKTEFEKLTSQNKKLIKALERLSKTGDGSHRDKHASFYDCLPTLQIEFSERIDYARAVLKEVGANP